MPSRAYGTFDVCKEREALLRLTDPECAQQCDVLADRCASNPLQHAIPYLVFLAGVDQDQPTATPSTPRVRRFSNNWIINEPISSVSTRSCGRDQWCLSLSIPVWRKINNVHIN
ncbi:hypothetical protein CHS0354_023250 [Potamilus streckersoni]|uniref:Uncharacterized protein n=1 Tax=Potamilus streckersoni TaxID=2493646 RepID=A0AAE0S3H0_9BIVA|nr:hypothetical protein CHS0354_023250 [Potamilus streckersoni]